jgi:MASE1
MATREQTPKEPGGLVDVAPAHPWSYAVSLLLVAVAYYVAAKLGLRLALVGRNITPIWPPTGIAVVAFILLGRSVWPGVALAAFAVNLPITTNGLAAAATAAGIPWLPWSRRPCSPRSASTGRSTVYETPPPSSSWVPC